MQQYPDIDRTLIEEHARLGYTEDEIEDILSALELNVSTAGIRLKDPKRVPWINRALAAIIQRLNDTLKSGHYDDLLNEGYREHEIRTALFTNLLSTKQLLARTAEAHASGEYERMHQLGYTDMEIRSLIRAGFAVSKLRALAERVNDAQRIGVDAQGLTVEQLNDMLFKDRPINGRRTLGIVTALLSGINSNTSEGEVARCIIEYVTMFDVPYGPGGTHGQVDVGTRYTIIEVKVGNVTDGKTTYRQIRINMHNDAMNPPDAYGRRKFIILYAPGYSKAATASITNPPPKGLGAYVVKSCQQLHEQIRQLGGP